MYDHVVIYYFSGTGNARAASHWIKEEAEQHKICTSVIEIKKHESPSIAQISEKTLIGFCYPTHGFNAPPIVLDFVARFPKTFNNDVFLLNTRAGMKLYKIFTPGLSGLAQWLPALFLLLKGYKCRGFRPLDLPSNWISLHPGVRVKVVESIFSRCKRITKKFTVNILNRKRVLRGWIDIPFDLFVVPIAFGYYIFGRFALAKTFFASYTCTRCNLCVKSCPTGSIKLVNDIPYWKFTCESCMKCMNQCPERAIETVHGLTFMLWWLAFSIVPWAIIHWMVDKGWIMVAFDSFLMTLIYYAVMIITGFAILFTGYRIFHFLLRFKIFNYLFTYTSLTKIRFWRRYFAPEKYCQKTPSGYKNPDGSG